MEVRVLQKFHDRVDYMKVYLVGETYTFDDARAESLIVRGLVESAEEPIEPISDTDEASTEENPDVVVSEEEVAEVAEVDEPKDETVVESAEVEEAPAEEVQSKVKPVATKRKSQKDN